MARTKISEFSATPGNNTDIDGINIAEGCAPSGINDAIRELMAQLKDWQSGTSGDSFTIGSAGTMTYSAGTANGVLYLNGSKVLTAGSALTFDGSQLDVPAGSASAPSLSTTADANTGIFFPAADVVGISTGGTERARVDSSGNLGLGVTPSAWGGSYKAFQFASGAVAGFSTTALDIYGNAYDSGAGAWKYLNSSQGATRYAAFNGQHQWFNAPSGTAGNAITFTQAMTLDASGRLLVGATSPTFSGDSQFSKTGNTFNLDVYAAGDGTSSNIAKVRLYTNSSNGAIGMAGDALVFYNASQATERARIDSSGRLLVGTSSDTSAEKLIVIGTAATTDTAQIQNSNSSTFVNSVLVLGATRNTTNSTFNFLTCVTQGVAFRLHIRDSGNVVNQNNSYGAISDAKLKENVTDATPKLDKLNQVRVVNYNLIGEEQKQIGVIAQELEQIFPGMVDETPDRDKEGNDLGTTTKSVKYSVFVPMLIKAMQEMKAIIDSQAERIAALEAK